MLSCGRELACRGRKLVCCDREIVYRGTPALIDVARTEIHTRPQKKHFHLCNRHCAIAIVHVGHPDTHACPQTKHSHLCNCERGRQNNSNPQPWHEQGFIIIPLLYIMNEVSP